MSSRTVQQNLILQILSKNKLDNNLMKYLNASDWDSILEMSSEHRLVPLMYWQLKKYHKNIHLPNSVNAFLEKAFKKSTFRSLEMQRELVLISRLLKASKIPHIFLKGAFLAFHSYPQSGLRQMRDLDFLVPEDMALFAYEILLNNGYKRHDEYLGDQDTYLRSSNHLPPILPVSGSFAIEVHAHLHHPNKLLNCDYDFDEFGLWERAIQRETSNENLSFLSETDLLLHLIAHAVYQHQFNNGPLLISDIAYLLQTAKIDWPLFWSVAKTAGWEKGCQLVFKIVDQYWGPQPVEYPVKNELPSNDLELMSNVAAFSMLGHYKQRGDVQLMASLMRSSSLGNFLKTFFRKLFPRRETIESYHGESLVGPMLMLAYIKRIARLICYRFPSYAMCFGRNELLIESRRVARLNQWLDCPVK